MLVRDCGLSKLRDCAAVAEYVVARRVPTFSSSEEKSVLHKSHGTLALGLPVKFELSYPW